jgi:hypothetical protein
MTTLGQAHSEQTTTPGFPEPSVRSTESPDVVAVVMDFVGATLPQVDRLLDGARFNSGDPGFPGSLFRWSRSTVDGVRVTEVWRSIRHFESFLRDVIGPRLGEAGVQEPELTTYAVHSYLTQGPTVGLDTRDGAAPITEP